MRSFINFLVTLPAVLAAPVVLETRQEDRIANSWIVRINQDAVLADVISQVTEAAGIESARHTYDFGSFKGFSIDGVSDLLGLVSNIASIQSIEPNTAVRTNARTQQNNVPSYGLARISQRQFTNPTTYFYDDSAGEGTFSYIIDTGIRTTHTDFGGRAVFGESFVEGEREGDGNGHGTHVAGTTGGTAFGVAKKTTLIAVKVLGAAGSGTNAGVLAGIDWAVRDAQSEGRIGRAVANLSLGGLFSPITNAAVTEASNAGLFLAVAAGNSGLPTITASPASARAVCTVGATDRDDARALFSNFGLLVDVFAPGVDITSAWKDSDTSTNTISGTSMAAPHVAGLGAYLLALEGQRSPAELCQRIQALSTKGALSGAILSRNQLAYNGIDA